jgi:isoleucyl-tRNA synthetase
LKFDELKTDFSFPKLEEEILKYWEKTDTFHKGIELHRHAPRFSFYEGPPTANGLPGVHHVIARTVKDMVCRYKQMRGFLVERKAGWDTHGLPEWRLLTRNVVSLFSSTRRTGMISPDASATGST